MDGRLESQERQRNQRAGTTGTTGAAPASAPANPKLPKRAKTFALSGGGSFTLEQQQRRGRGRVATSCGPLCSLYKLGMAPSGSFVRSSAPRRAAVACGMWPVVWHAMKKPPSPSSPDPRVSPAHPRCLALAPLSALRRHGCPSASSPPTTVTVPLNPPHDHDLPNRLHRR